MIIKIISIIFYHILFYYFVLKVDGLSTGLAFSVG